MKPSDRQYDIVIVGSGLGGLLCAAILGKEGYRVCVLEKNRQYGGCLQSFSRRKVLFDSGVHYMGALGPGETLYQIFKYAGVIGNVRLEKMDEAVFDRIVFLEDGKEYDFAQGYPAFLGELEKHFPEESAAIRQYGSFMQEVCRRFPLYRLEWGEGLAEKMSVLDIPASDYIATLTENKRLRELMAGNNLLYAGIEGKTPFYVHALVLNSYIQSSWKCLDGGSQITRFLIKQIRNQGGELFNHCTVTALEDENGRLVAARLKDGTRVMGDSFISNLHPQQTLAMTDSTQLRQVYRRRIGELQNTISSFCVYAVLKPGSIPYEKHNYYLHARDGVWKAISCERDQWPMTCFVHFSASSHAIDYAESVTLMTYMPFEWVAQWSDSFNTDAEPGDRGKEYDAFKKEMGDRLIALMEQRFPGISEAMEFVYHSTPLSYRDYIGTSDGSLYGVAKIADDPISGIIPSRTRIPNLHLTGQNLLLHGLLGVSVGALQTCAGFTDPEKLLEKIKNA
ncbi:phytoene desaturase family protein [Flavihumibacter petaseus]|uniref:Putative oxidoreductase n=1 Tax=Flavihumibacter petaseus NBRC 106054 TaxID=1220578 RepID=A0A0E9MXF4_9BACT|nr:NAD(P)/FAD-dependent oxidoreductase [Flavihumibacter petaseus]GAO42101.1 putative oxidoreductase [Flavihumibacter petaseus NBRC 106054]